jgi:hypothetical protein
MAGVGTYEKTVILRRNFKKRLEALLRALFNLGVRDKDGWTGSTLIGPV